MRRILAGLLLLIIAGTLRADFSSLTPAERATIETALSQAWEYRALIDGIEGRRILEAVRVDGDKWRVRVEFAVPKIDGSRRLLIRDVYLSIKAQTAPHWPYAIGGLVLGFGIGAGLVAILAK